MVSGVIYLSPDKTTGAQWAHKMHSFFDQHWEWGPLSIWCCHTLLPWITPDLPLHCLQPIYTASSSLAVTETAVLSQEAWKTSSVTGVSHLSLQSLTSRDIPTQFYELHLPFLVVWGFFGLCLFVFHPGDLSELTGDTGAAGAMPCVWYALWEVCGTKQAFLGWI